MDKVFSLPDKKRLLYLLFYVSLATVVFVVIYGLCNSLAAQATTRYSMFTEWELQIPLVPWMIYPYISLNLLLLVAMFVIKDLSAIKAHCISLSVAAVLAGIVFYFFPAQLGFLRENVEGYHGLYQKMFEIDHPHNLFPSLHVTYSSITIWAMIEQTKNIVFHQTLRVWLVLISMSVVLVHQHHLFDIITGFLLAIIVYKYVYSRIHSNNFKPFGLF